MSEPQLWPQRRALSAVPSEPEAPRRAGLCESGPSWAVVVVRGHLCSLAFSSFVLRYWSWFSSQPPILCPRKLGRDSLVNTGCGVLPSGLQLASAFNRHVSGSQLLGMEHLPRVWATDWHAFGSWLSRADFCGLCLELLCALSPQNFVFILETMNSHPQDAQTRNAQLESSFSVRM